MLVPLGIPRFPLPSILAALVLDGLDGAIFQAAGADVGDYQSYDKALDVYYLTVAYASTLRNWTDPGALAVGRVLFYYRLVGVVAFELTGVRALLLVFPNVFEYFFIVYEAVRVRWNPARLRPRQLVGIAAVIWIVIKPPQEWWIHVAGLDFTDEVAEHDWALPALGVAAALAVAVAVPLSRRLPPPDWRPTFDADAHTVRPPGATVASRLWGRSLWTWALAEKVALLSMVAVIFSEALPGVRAGEVRVAGAASPSSWWRTPP